MAGARRGTGAWSRGGSNPLGIGTWTVIWLPGTRTEINVQRPEAGQRKGNHVQ